MNVYFGERVVEKLYFGEIGIVNAYVGTKEIYASITGPPIPINIENIQEYESP